MNECIMLYLQNEYDKQQRRELRTMASKLRKAQAEIGPLIAAKNKAEMYRRRQGDGFVILDYGWTRP